MERLGGVGLKNILVIWLFIVLLTVMAKVIVTKHPVNGLSQLILSV